MCALVYCRNVVDGLKSAYGGERGWGARNIGYPTPASKWRGTSRVWSQVGCREVDVHMYIRTECNNIQTQQLRNYIVSMIHSVCSAYGVYVSGRKVLLVGVIDFTSKVTHAVFFVFSFTLCNIIMYNTWMCAWNSGGANRIADSLKQNCVISSSALEWDTSLVDCCIQGIARNPFCVAPCLLTSNITAHIY